MKCPTCKVEELPCVAQFIVETKTESDGRTFVYYTCKKCWNTFKIR